MRILSTKLLITTFITYSSAQTTIKPGDRVLRYDWIKPSHDFDRCVIRDTAGNVKYDFMMEAYPRIDTQKKQVIFARQRQIPAGYFEADTSVTDFNLRPVNMHEVHSPQNVSFKTTFDDTLASVVTIRKAVTSVKKYPMHSGYFEDNMIEYIWGYLELQKGVTYGLDNFNKDTAHPSDPYTLQYAFDDMWPLAANRQLNCIVLQFTHGGTSGYIWIDKVLIILSRQSVILKQVRM